MTSREKAMKWWNNIPNNEKYTLILKYKDKIFGYNHRKLSSLTELEIEVIYITELVNLGL